VEEVGQKIDPVYRELICHAAQGDIIYNDDTVAKILARLNTEDKDKKRRKSLFTSGIASTSGNTKIAAVKKFFT
jgi:hypothetical protein